MPELKTHIIRNEWIELKMIPEQGGRIDDLLDRATGKNWLWHPEGYQLKDRVLALGASFDENWCGGFEEIFPADSGGWFKNFELVDHGELWSQPWTILESDSRGIKLTYSCRRVPVDVEKSVSISAARPEIELKYVFRSQSDQSVPYLFKLHPAIAIEEGDEIVFPEDSVVEPVTLDFSNWIGRPERSSFPQAKDLEGNDIDLSRVPAQDAMKQEFYYTHLSQRNRAPGFAGIKNPRTRKMLRFEFDRSELPYVWNFQSYGKWRGHYTLVLEPCTNVPRDLNQALENKTCAMLRPRETREYRFKISLDHY